MIVEIIKNNYGKKAKCKCDYCGSIFFRRLGHIRKLKRHFCDVKCYSLGSLGIEPWNKGKSGTYHLSREAAIRRGIAQRGLKRSEETKKKISEAHKGEKNQWFGKHLSEEHKRKIGIKQIGNTNTRGRHHTDEAKLKLKIAHSREKSYMWKGGRVVDSSGYILIKNTEHPYADKNGYVFEHRLIIEKKLGRYLLPAEVIHHINGIKDDNREENLELFKNNSEHISYHQKILKVS